jgi:hypothetical protein
MFFRDDRMLKRFIITETAGSGKNIPAAERRKKNG